MSPSNDDTRSAASAAAGKPSLEALLRLKRAERPDAAFWADFDRGLRQKQLAAIIEPKPWWLGLALLGRRLAPAGLPISAAAAALFAVMVVRTQSPFVQATGPVEFGPGQVLHANPPTAKAGPAPATFAPAPTAQPATLVASAPTPAVPDAASSSVAPLAPAVATDSVPARASAPAIPVVASLLEIAPQESVAPTPSELAIAHNLATVRAEEPALVAAAARLDMAEVQDAASETPAIEPALKMEVRNPRHARVLLAMAASPEVDSSSGIAHLRDRTVRSLSDDDALTGSASRLGLGGDRLSLSF